jgi:hypothetical protein
MPASWKVTGQRQTTVYNGVSYVPAMIVGILTGAGNYVNVTIDGDHYNVNDAKPALQAAADAADDISGLGEGTVPTPGQIGT